MHIRDQAHIERLRHGTYVFEDRVIHECGIFNQVTEAVDTVVVRDPQA